MLASPLNWAVDLPAPWAGGACSVNMERQRRPLIELRKTPPSQPSFQRRNDDEEREGLPPIQRPFRMLDVAALEQLGRRPEQGLAARAAAMEQAHQRTVVLRASRQHEVF